MFLKHLWSQPHVAPCQDARHVPGSRGHVPEAAMYINTAMCNDYVGGGATTETIYH